MIDIIEILFSSGLIISAILALIQALKIFRCKSGGSISYVSCFGTILIQITAVLHGYRQDDNLLMYGTLLNILATGLIAFLLVYYRKEGNKAGDGKQEASFNYHEPIKQG